MVAIAAAVCHNFAAMDAAMLEQVGLVVAGLLSGVVSGLTGANGMGIVLSVLLLSGHQIHEVIGLCLLSQIFTMSTAAFALTRSTKLRWRLLPALCVPSAFFAVVGAKVALRIPKDPLTVMIIVGIGVIGLMLVRAKRKHHDEPPEDAHPSTKAYAIVGVTGGLSGFMAGLAGGGGNIIVANALHKLLALRFHQAVLLSLCLGVVSAALGSSPYILEGRVDLAHAPLIIAPALVSAWIAAGYNTKFDPVTIKRIQGWYLLFIAGILALRHFAG